MNEGEREILRILNGPRLVRGEKADLVAKLTGTRQHPTGSGMADIKRTTRGAMKGSSRRALYGIDRPWVKHREDFRFRKERRPWTR
jgi:hypothetical protein